MSLNHVVWIDRGWQPVAIGFCPSKKAWKRAARQNKIVSKWPDLGASDGHTEWLRNDAGEGIILVAIDANAEQDALSVIVTLVHEAVHVWQFICQHIGEDAPGIEMEAYGIAAISRGLVEAYCRTLGKDKNWPV